jgi:hypothetical protein
MMEAGMMMDAVRTSETSFDNYFTRQYIPEDNSERILNPITNKEKVTPTVIGP